MSNRRVLLTDIGDNKIHIIKLLREITGLGLAEAKDLAERCPSELYASDLQIAELRAAGAVLEVTDDAPAPAAPVSTTESAPAPEAKQDDLSWSNWKNLPAGHGQSTAAMIALRRHTDAFRKELVQARNEWEAAKATSQQTYDSVTAAARKQCQSEHSRYTNEYETNVRNTEARRSKVGQVMNACHNFLNNLPAKHADGARQAAQRTMADVEAKRSNVASVINAKLAAYKDLHDCQLAESEREQNEKLNKARAEQISRDTQAERTFEEKTSLSAKSAARILPTALARPRSTHTVRISVPPASTLPTMNARPPCPTISCSARSV